MQVNVEKVSSVEYKLNITIPTEQIDSATEQKIKEIASQANLKGFRPGKAPISLIKQRYGQEARGEALTTILQKSIDDALTQHQLRPINTPQVTPVKMNVGEDLVFNVVFEVLPEIESVKFALNNIEKLNVPITENDVEYVINQLRKQYSKWNAVEREAKVGDRVVIDFKANLEGKEDPDSKTENYPLELGANTMIPGFEDGLVGLKANESKQFNLIMPENYHVADKAGKPVDFHVTVKQVIEADKPEINEEFVKQFGIESGLVDDLKKQIRQSLEQERDQAVKEKLKEQVFNQLLKDNPLEVPSSLIEREAKAIHDEMHPSAKGEKEPHSHSKEELDGYRDIAKKRIVVSLLINHYTTQNKIKPDNDRVLKRIKEIASVYEQPKEVEEWLSTGKQRANVESQVLEDQILEKLIAESNVTEKQMTYAELKGINI